MSKKPNLKFFGKKKGKFRRIRNILSTRKGGVIISSKNAVPDIPLSKSFAGVKNRVTPTALIIPAAVSAKKFFKDSFVFSYSVYFLPTVIFYLHIFSKILFNLIQNKGIFYLFILSKQKYLGNYLRGFGIFVNKGQEQLSSVL